MKSNLLFIIALPALVLLLAACSAPSGEDAPQADAQTETVTPERLRLYYFHRTLRCEECLSMELFTDVLMRSRFEDALIDEQLAYVVVNLDEFGNDHYEAAFDLTFSTLVLVAEDASDEMIRWKKLEAAWEKALDEEAFSAYVTDEVTEWLDKLPPS